MLERKPIHFLIYLKVGEWEEGEGEGEGEKMEELRKLEKVQRVVEFMESKGLAATSSSSNSNRFLAKIMLLLVSPKFLTNPHSTRFVSLLVIW